MDALTDPDDWGPLSPARKLDASLRCAVCGELFSAPVTLACGHACEFLLSLVQQLKRWEEVARRVVVVDAGRRRRRLSRVLAHSIFSPSSPPQ
jgi:hypothetical protein